MALSKINHTQLSNDFIDRIMSRVNGNAVKVFLAISRKTIGWHKDTDEISLTQLEAMTGLSRKTILSAVQMLIKADVITATASRGRGHSTTYSVNYIEKGGEIPPIDETKGGEIPPISPVKGGDIPPIKPLKGGKFPHTKESIKERVLKKGGNFTPPTLEQVEAYILEKHLRVNGKRFFDYFDAGEWIDGKGNPVRNWKQKLITWDRHEPEKKGEFNVEEERRKLALQFEEIKRRREERAKHDTGNAIY
jgi:phage replication O-like protein O